MSDHLLAGTYLKLRRAHSHLDALYDALGAFRESHGDVISIHIDSETGDEVWVASEDIPQLDPETSLITGDIVHNARASLDYLANALVRWAGNEPTTLTQFPIFITAKGFRKRGRDQARGMAPGMVRFIERTQPYKRSPQPKEHPLWLLHTLDVIDKHREPHVALAALSSLMILPTEEEIPAFVGPLEPGTELSRIPVRQTQVEQRPFIDVVFRDLPVRTWPVTWVLGDVLVEVGVVLERFREAFFKSADGTLPNFDPLNPPRDRPPTGTG